MRSHMRLGIDVGYKFSSIKGYFELLVGGQFTAKFADWYRFPTSGGENKQLEKIICWKRLSLNSLDPHSNVYEPDVQSYIKTV